MNEFVYYLVNHNADLSIEVDWRIRNAWCSSRKYVTFELYDRPSASPQAQSMDANKSQGTRDNAVCGCVIRGARAPATTTRCAEPTIAPRLTSSVDMRTITPTTRCLIWTRLSTREMRASRRFCAGGGSC